MEWGVNELPCLGDDSASWLDALLGRPACSRPPLGALKFQANAKDPKAVNFNPSTF